MSRLLNPDPGELVDRMTILELKIAHVELQKDFDNDERKTSGGVVARTIVSNPMKINVHPFVDELEGIRTYLVKNFIPDIEPFDDKSTAYDNYYNELKEVNNQLWDLEDIARTLRDAPGDMSTQSLYARGYDTMCKITTANDKRAEIVKSINGLWGFNTQEKLH